MGSRPSKPVQRPVSYPEYSVGGTRGLLSEHIHNSRGSSRSPSQACVDTNSNHQDQNHVLKKQESIRSTVLSQNSMEDSQPTAKLRQLTDRLCRVQEILTIKTHTKCRNAVYPREKEVFRVEVPEDKVSWNVVWKDYAPLDYTTDRILNKRPVWADPDIRNPAVMESEEPLLFNFVQGSINRQSHHGTYQFSKDNGVKLPINPIGRTGMKGRGCLGRWGPNHAADPIVTRWKRDANGKRITAADGNYILQFVAVQRADTKEWAIPGGMVDPGECVTQTVKREFGEEAMNSLEANAEEKQRIKAAIDDVFEHGYKIYKGYVDDPRNTDNAWMETVAFNFHDDDGTSVGKMELNAGDDAVGVRWADITPDIKLFASHSRLVRGVGMVHGVFDHV